jgi:hypothetical protein
MLVVKVLFAMVVFVALTGGAVQLGYGLGLGAFSWVLATAIVVGAIIAIDPANRRG